MNPRIRRDAPHGGMQAEPRPWILRPQPWHPGHLRPWLFGPQQREAAQPNRPVRQEQLRAAAGVDEALQRDPSGASLPDSFAPDLDWNPRVAQQRMQRSQAMGTFAPPWRAPGARQKLPPPLPMSPLVTRSDEEAWQASFRRVRQFHAEHASLEITEGSKLADWLAIQRNTLLNENSDRKIACRETRSRRRAQLEALGINFTREARGRSDEKVWQTCFRLVEEYKAAHGNVQIPALYPPNQELSDWLRRQCFVLLDEDSGGSDATRNLRKAKLRSLGVEFPGDINKNRVDPVNLEEEASDEPRSTNPAGLSTGFESRQNSASSETTLTVNTPASLQEEDENSWYARYRELSNFKETHGHVSVPAYSSDHPLLGRWLMKQRFFYLPRQIDEIGDVRRKMLESLGVMCGKRRQPLLSCIDGASPKRQKLDGNREGDQAIKKNGYNDETWCLRVRQLVQFKEEYGHARVPQNFPPNQKLARWLHSQRCFLLRHDHPKRIRCPVERTRRREQLETLGVAFIAQPYTRVQLVKSTPTDEEVWQERFEELKEYKRKHGNVSISACSSTNAKLSRWLMKQRFWYLQKPQTSVPLELVEARRAKLQELGVHLPRRVDYSSE